MIKEVVIFPEELQILLFHHRKRIKVDYPPTNIQLFDIKPHLDHYELNFYCEPEDFTLSKASKEWTREHPSYGDILQCLLAAGLLSYPNLEDLQVYIQSMRNLKRSVVYVPDTNLLYNQFLSSTNIIEPEEVVLIELSQKEILASSNHKFTGRELSEIKREIKFQGHLYDELNNRRKKASRQAYNLALSEYNKYLGKAAHVIKVQEFNRDKEKNDIILVELVNRFFKERNLYPVVLTCDALLKDVCEAYSMEYFLLELPKSLETGVNTPNNIISLLDKLAQVLGFIKIENMILYGEYRGKHPGEIKLVSLGNQLSQEMVKDLRICKELGELNILF